MQRRGETKKYVLQALKQHNYFFNSSGRAIAEIRRFIDQNYGVVLDHQNIRNALKSLNRDGLVAVDGNAKKTYSVKYFAPAASSLVIEEAEVPIIEEVKSAPKFYEQTPDVDALKKQIKSLQQTIDNLKDIIGAQKQEITGLRSRLEIAEHNNSVLLGNGRVPHDRLANLRRFERLMSEAPRYAN